MTATGPPSEVSDDEALSVFARSDRPCRPLTADDIASALSCAPGAAERTLDDLVDSGDLHARDIGNAERVWWRPADGNGNGNGNGDDEWAGPSETDAEQLGAFVNAVDEYAIFMLDPDGIVSSWNEGAKRIKGYTRDEILGEHISIFYRHADVEAGLADENLRRAASEGRAEDEGWRIRKDGSRFWAKVILTAVYDDDGELRGYVKVTRDLTDQKRRERELQRYESIIEAVGDPVYELDEDGHYTYVNDAFVEETGYPREDIIGEHVSKVLPEEDIERGTEVIKRLLRAPDRRTATWEMTRIRSDGERVPAENHVALLPFDEGGNFTGTAGVIRDISERKARENELERRKSELETELSEILGRISDAFYALDADWRFTHVNERAEEFLDRPRETLLGERIWELFPDAGGGPIRERFDEAMTTQRAVNFTIDYEPLERWFEFNVYPSETGLSVYFRDITDRVEREHELERYETIVETVNDGIYTVDADGRFTMVNRTYAEMTGYPPEELIGSHVSLVVDESIAAKASERERELSAGERETAMLEADIRTADGGSFPAEATFAMIPDADGSGHERVGVVRDITERRVQERALEESERRYRTLVEHFPNGAVALVDEDLRYQTVGGTPIELNDVTIEELAGRRADEILAPAVADRLVPAYRAAFEGEPSSFEAEFGDHTYQIHIVPVRDDDGEIFATMGMSQDITDRKAYERELQEAKAQLEAATEAGAVGTWEWRIPEDRFVAGQSFAKLFGVDPEAAQSGVPLELFVESIHRNDRDRVLEMIDEAVESCGEYEAEYRVWNADEELRWVFARGHVECDEDGSPLRFPGAIADITERKRAELELERHRNQLQTLFRILPVGVVVADADGAILEANDTAREIWGRDAFEAESLEQYTQYRGWWADTGEPVDVDEWTMARVLDGEDVTDPDVFEIVSDGERRIIMVHGTPIRDANGAVIRGVVTQTDITERRKYQERLEASEQRYRTLAENFPEGVVALFDDDLRYTAAGGQLLDEFYETVGDPVGDRVLDRYPDELMAEIEPKFRAALEGEANEFEVEYLGRHLRAYTLPIEGSDDVGNAGMLVVQDITERTEYRRQLETTIGKLEESNERLQQFAYICSHDLQEPLRMISSYLQLLEDRYRESLDADAEEFIEYAVTAADRMRAMINDLLKYSRVESDANPLEPTDGNAVIDEVLDQLQLQIEETGAEVVVDELPTVRADAQQLEQVFQNLVSNAIKYRREDGTPRVEIGADRDGESWRFSVADNGIGIEPDRTDRIFEIFKRLHSDEEYPGTGIGLALCEKIVDRHGGEIWVESEPGEGSTFYFTIPDTDDPDD